MYPYVLHCYLVGLYTVYLELVLLSLDALSQHNNTTV